MLYQCFQSSLSSPDAAEGKRSPLRAPRRAGSWIIIPRKELGNASTSAAVIDGDVCDERSARQSAATRWRTHFVGMVVEQPADGRAGLPGLPINGRRRFTVSIRSAVRYRPMTSNPRGGWDRRTQPRIIGRATCDFSAISVLAFRFHRTEPHDLPGDGRDRPVQSTYCARSSRRRTPHVDANHRSFYQTHPLPIRQAADLYRVFRQNVVD